MIWYIKHKIECFLYWLKHNEGNIVGSIFLMLLFVSWLEYEQSKKCMPYNDIAEAFSAMEPVVLKMVNVFIQLAHADIISTIIVLYAGLFFIGWFINLFFFVARIVAWPILLVLAPVIWLAKICLRIGLFKAEELIGRFINLSGYWEFPEVQI